MNIESINPANGERIATYAPMGSSEWAPVVEAAGRAAESWGRQGLDRRVDALKRLSAALRKGADRNAHLMAREMGKPVSQGRAEIEKCAWVCEHYAERAEEYLKPEKIETEASNSWVSFEPLGLILAVMPWNFPFWQVFRFAAPALAAGNGAVLKHASNVSGCALAIEEVIREAGFPRDLFRTLLMRSGDVGDVVRHPLVRAVTLTGSAGAGRSVAGAAGEALKKSVLELGGSDPYLILADADIDEAARICAASRLINSGQSCIAAKRFIVIESVKEPFERALVDRMREARLGDPLRDDTQVGPLAREDLRVELYQQVERSVAKGAKLLAGGELPKGPGWFYPPTVLADARPGMPVFDEETFGPVAAVTSARDEDEAVSLANGSAFGLGAAVFTRAPERAVELIRRLETGSCFVNELVKSDPRLPFGGVKGSGYGRELGKWGMLEFVNAKTVWVK